MRVAVLFGGRSGEHEVSLMSAESVMKALDPAKYEVIPIGITKDGRWLVGDDPLAALKEGAKERLAQMVPAAFLADPAGPGLVAVGGRPPAELAERLAFDVVFPVLHGPNGEDGTVQGLLDLAGVPYVGSGVAGSAVGMDKALMKAVFRSAGLPVLDYVVIKRKHIASRWDQIREQVASLIGYPCFVKPANLGSSVGISKVKQEEELRDALEEAARYDRKILVEKAAEGFREVEVSVLGNDEPETSIPGEIVPGGEFYDYRAKYLDDSSELIIPARISPQATDEVRRLAAAAFLAVDAAGLARVDFFVHPETETIYVNEINTMPGFTRISMYPKLWEASGLPYPQLIDRLIELAFERHREKRAPETGFAGEEA
ncbi:MAG: D-alanine--D-alanine ligase [Clostridia bacterium]